MFGLVTVKSCIHCDESSQCGIVEALFVMNKTRWRHVSQWLTIAGDYTAELKLSRHCTNRSALYCLQCLSPFYDSLDSWANSRPHLFHNLPVTSRSSYPYQIILLNDRVIGRACLESRSIAPPRSIAHLPALLEKKFQRRPQFLHVFGRVPSDLQLCFVQLKTLAPSASYSTFKYPVTLKSGLGVAQGHRKL